MYARSLCSDLVRVEWVDEEGWTHELAAVLEDISPGGACLQVESPIPTETEVRVRQGNRWKSVCRTKYCEFREIGYFIGLQFRAGERWNPESFNPRHLLDLTHLIQELNARAVH